LRVLLDTHIFLWAVSEPARLSDTARKYVEEADVYVSAASIWEISIKCGIGKLEVNPAELLAGVTPAGFTLLPVTGEHAAKVVELPYIHKDPFDRMLIAQASVEPMILLTNDTVLGGYGGFVQVA